MYSVDICFGTRFALAFRRRRSSNSVSGHGSAPQNFRFAKVSPCALSAAQQAAECDHATSSTVGTNQTQPGCGAHHPGGQCCAAPSQHWSMDPTSCRHGRPTATPTMLLLLALAASWLHRSTAATSKTRGLSRHNSTQPLYAPAMLDSSEQ